MQRRHAPVVEFAVVVASVVLQQVQVDDAQLAYQLRQPAHEQPLPGAQIAQQHLTAGGSASGVCVYSVYTCAACVVCVVCVWCVACVRV